MATAAVTAAAIIRFSLRAIPLLVLKVSLKILLIVLFYVTEFLKIFTLADEPFAKALQILEIVY